MFKDLTVTFFLLFVGITAAMGQEADIKDEKVMIDGKQILRYEKINIFEQSLFSLDGDEILFLKKATDASFDYYILNFVTAKKKIVTSDISHIYSGAGLNSKKNLQKVINWLLKEKVLDSEGKINQVKLDIFFEKYNEDLSKRKF